MPLSQNRHKWKLKNIEDQVVFKLLNSSFQRLFGLVGQLSQKLTKLMTRKKMRILNEMFAGLIIYYLQ